MEIRVECQYCGPGKLLFCATPGSRQDPAVWLRAWRRSLTAAPGSGPQISNIDCDCGARFTLQDGGDESAPARKNISAPRIDGIAPGNGRFGSTRPVKILGTALDVGTLRVKFGVSDAEILGRSSNLAVVRPPVGQLRLNIAEGPLHRLCVSPTTVSFLVDEVVSLGKSGLGRVRLSQDNVLYVWVEAGDVVSGLDIVGKTSGAAARITSYSVPPFQEDEAVRGSLTGSTGRIINQCLVVDPSGAFAPNELVIGQTSAAVVRLSGSPAFDGRVTVTVQNDYGQRPDGSSCLRDSFTYH